MISLWKIQMRLQKGFRLVDAQPAATKLSVWEKLNGQKLGSLPPPQPPKYVFSDHSSITQQPLFYIVSVSTCPRGSRVFTYCIYTPMCSIPLGNGSMCRIPYFKGAQEWIITVQLFWEGHNIWQDIPLNLTFTYLGTIQVLRHHVFDFFRPIHPPLWWFTVLLIIKNCHFLTTPTHLFDDVILEWSIIK